MGRYYQNTQLQSDALHLALFSDTYRHAPKAFFADAAEPDELRALKMV
jgi:hypothetical protein